MIPERFVRLYFSSFFSFICRVYRLWSRSWWMPNKLRPISSNPSIVISSLRFWLKLCMESVLEGNWPSYVLTDRMHVSTFQSQCLLLQLLFKIILSGEVWADCLSWWTRWRWNSLLVLLTISLCSTISTSCWSRRSRIWILLISRPSLNRSMPSTMLRRMTLERLFVISWFNWRSFLWFRVSCTRLKRNRRNLKSNRYLVLVVDSDGF